MPGPEKNSRVAIFLATHGPLNERTEALIWHRVHLAGWGVDDPASVQIAHDTLFEARMRGLLAEIKQAPFELKKSMATSIKALQAAQMKGEANYAWRIADRIADETRNSLAKSLPKLEAQLKAGARGANCRVVLGLCAGVLIFSAVIAAGGFVMGRAVIHDLQAQYQDLAGRPDAASWQALQRANGDLDDLIADKCASGQAGHINDATGRRACFLPLWLE